MLDLKHESEDEASKEPPRQAGAPDDARPAEGAWSSDHPINLRLSLPLPFGRYYISLVAGKERRSRRRLVQERVRHPIATAGNLVLLAAAGSVAGLAMLALIQLLGRFLLGQLGMAVFP